jgi:hypothetical protein
MFVCEHEFHSFTIFCLQNSSHNKITIRRMKTYTSLLLLLVLAVVLCLTSAEYNLNFLDDLTANAPQPASKQSNTQFLDFANLPASTLQFQPTQAQGNVVNQAQPTQQVPTQAQQPIQQQQPQTNIEVPKKVNNVKSSGKATKKKPMYNFNVDDDNVQQKPVAPAHPEIPYHVLYIIVGVIAFVSFTATLLFGAFVGILFFKYKVKAMNDAKAGSYAPYIEEIGLNSNYHAIAKHA